MNIINKNRMINRVISKGFDDMDRVKRQIHYWCRDVAEGHIAGQNVNIAVLDSGVSAHPDFDGRLLAFYDCVNGRTELYDDNGHGTHVSGILAGDGRMSRGRYRGIAPEAGIVAVKILDARGEGSVEQILRGLQWVRKHYKRYGIRVLNISVGADRNLEKKKEEVMLREVEMLWDCGITVVVSAGNYGPGEGTVAAPGNSRKVITVGTMADSAGKNGNSGIGPTRQCVVKPDLVAPGYRIVSCNGAYEDAIRMGKGSESGGRGTEKPRRVQRKRILPYVEKSGTSMAAPVVAGAAALYHSKYQDSSNVEVKLRLRETCERGRNREQEGWGCIRIDRFLCNSSAMQK